MSIDEYDKRYSGNELYWGLNPDTLVIRLTDILPEKGRILDLGSGEGRNALYLAKKGFDVTAVDFSENGINKSKKMAKENNVNIEHIIDDISSKNFKSKIGEYNAIISINSLQFLDKTQINFVLNYMKKHTNSKGYNIISSFLNHGKSKFKEGELKQRYNDWIITPNDYNEFLGEIETHGEAPHRHYKVNLIAQKPDK